MSRVRHISALLALSIALCGLHASGAAASSSQEAIFDATGSLRSSPGPTLRTLRELGVTRLRVAVPWATIAPNPHGRRKPRHFDAADPASYPRRAWAVYDRIVRGASAQGIDVYFMLTGPAPIWATGRDQPPGGPRGNWKPSAHEYGSFVRAVGSRYSGSYAPPGSSTPLPRVSAWSIWNEPNYGPNLAPQATSDDRVELGAARYRLLLDAGWGGLHRSGHGSDRILIGETAPRGLDHPIGNFSGVKPLRFLRALYCVDGLYHQLRGSAASARGCPTSARGSHQFRSRHPALFAASGFADHPYEQNTAPNKPTTSDPSKYSSDPNYADLPEVPRLERTLDHLNRVYGSHTHFPVYSTEYGYRTNPPDRRVHISPTTAARYMNWAEYLSWRQPRLVSYAQYLLIDPPNRSFASGLEFPNGVHKVTYDAYRLPLFLPATSTRRGRHLEVWGCVRPAHFASIDTGRAQTVRIQLRRGHHGPFRTIETVGITNVRGYFAVRVAFRTSGDVRLAWTNPNGAEVHSRTVSIKIR